MELASKYYRHSGFKIDSFAFLAQRYDVDIGFVPGESECHVFLVRREGGGNPRLNRVLSTTGWFTGLWLSQTGDLFTSSAEGELFVAPGSKLLVDEHPWKKVEVDATLLGVWGSSFSSAFAWGMSNGRSRLFAWDGNQWTEQAAPGFIIEAMHGTAEGPRLVSGRGGMVARNDRGAWSEYQTPVPEILVSVHVAGAGEYYAAGNMGTVLEGSDGGWGVIGRIPNALEGDVQAVAKWQGTLWVAAGRLGLWRRVGKSSQFEVVDPGLFAIALDTRDELIVGCEDSIAVSTDGRTFQSKGEGAVDKILAAKPLGWFAQ
jgi:hypothetical protein